VTLERTLAQWAASAQIRSQRVSALVRDALVDVTGCIVAGSVETSTQAAIQVAKQLGPGLVLAMSSNLRLPAPSAAFIDATAAHALDFDDNFGPATTHATAVLMPALGALAGETESSAGDVMEAYVIGLELQARIGRLVNPEHYEKGWHATSTVGAIGTAGACARLLRLNPEQTLAAISIASSMASGSKKQFGSMMKPLHAGLAAKNAVLAARMAEAGIRGDPQPLGGQWGFAQLFGAGRLDEESVTRVLQDLGTNLAIETDGLLVKRFPCCGAAHRTLDGLLELRQRLQLRLEDVESIEVFIPAFARENLRFDDPQDESQARFSLTYPALRVLQSGGLSLHDMVLERIRDPSIRPWLRRVLIHVKAGSVSEALSATATPAVTRVITRGNTVAEIGIAAPKGSRQHPLTEDERYAKFRDCCGWADREKDADRLFAAARSLHEKTRFRDFCRALARMDEAHER
jgi:2-methylcitrate dehydratase PrpD